MGTLHVERGFDAEDSVVTLFAMTSDPDLTVDEGSLDGRALAGTLEQATHTILNARAYSFTNCLLVVCRNTLIRLSAVTTAKRKYADECRRSPQRLTETSWLMTHQVLV